MNWLAVALGGAAGSMLRYWVSLSVNGRLAGFPWGTLTVNVVGSLLIGLCYAFIQQRFSGNEFLRLLIIVGFLGGFTTFSAFSLETMQLLQSGMVIKALIYILASVCLCVIAALVGIEAGKFFSS